MSEIPISSSSEHENDQVADELQRLLDEFRTRPMPAPLRDDEEFIAEIRDGSDACPPPDDTLG